MSDFHDRLRQRKQELLAERLPPSEPAVSDAEIRRMELDAKVAEIAKSLKHIAVGALLIIMFMSAFILRDWWNFIGSPEYAQWKERVERTNN